MKKNILFAVLAVAALSSCSQNDAIESIAQDNNAINFSTYVGRNNRAAITYLDGLRAAGAGFYVLGYSTGNTAWASVADTDKKLNFMLGDNVTWNGTSTAWEYTNQKYWPNAVDGTNPGKVSFFAYAPNGGNVSVENSLDTAGDPIITYTCPADQLTQVDLVTASATDQTKASNVTQNGRVDLTFNHALSKIAFTAVKAANYDNATITVKELEVAYSSNIVKKNTFNMAATIGNGWGTATEKYAGTEKTTIYTDATGEALGWNKNEATSTDEAITFEFSPEKAAADPNPAVKSNNYLMLIPQTVVAGDLKATLTYDVKDEARNSTVTNKVTVDLAAITWEKGKQYTYKLIVTLSGVTFTVDSVSEWMDGTQPTDTNI